MVDGFHPTFSRFGRTPFLRRHFAATGRGLKPDSHPERSEGSSGMLLAGNARLDPSLRSG
jgi:hypothetical protein